MLETMPKSYVLQPFPFKIIENLSVNFTPWKFSFFDSSVSSPWDRRDSTWDLRERHKKDLIVRHKNQFFVFLTNFICVNSIYNFSHDIMAQKCGDSVKMTRMTTLHW